MNKEYRSISQGRPKFRSTKYSTIFKRNKISFEPQGKPIPINRNNISVNVERFGKIVDFNTKRKSMPFTTEVNITSQDFYLKTFNSLMINKYDKQNFESLDTDIILNHYKSQFDQKQSNFTLMDVMNKPIKFIGDQISSITKELKGQNYEVEMLRYELHSLDFMVKKRIQDIKETTITQLTELRKMLKNSEIYENQRKLRNKKQLRFIQKGHSMNKNKFQSLKQKSLQIQTVIFDCQPLQLQFYRQNAPQQRDGYL